MGCQDFIVILVSVPSPAEEKKKKIEEKTQISTTRLAIIESRSAGRPIVYSPHIYAP